LASRVNLTRIAKVSLRRQAPNKIVRNPIFSRITPILKIDFFLIRILILLLVP